MNDLATRFQQLYTGAVSDILDRRGFRNQALPQRLAPMSIDMKIAGPAFTGRGEPTDDNTDDDSHRRLEMLESVPTGSVSVWDCGGHQASAHWGEIMSRVVMERGCVGAVVDGGLRDSSFVADLEFPVFYAFRSVASSVGRWNIVEWNQEITIGSTKVRPGDWIFGDVDGVLVIPTGLVEEVLAEAEEHAAVEAEMRAELAAGALPSDVYARLGGF